MSLMSYGAGDNTISLMYRLMGAMSHLGYPVVFKGAMVLNIIARNLPLQTGRMTEDIDGDWVGTNITNEELFKRLQAALSLLGQPNLYIKQTRQYGHRKSAGFEVKKRDDDETLFTLDIGVKSNKYYVKYSNKGIDFMGSHPNKIYADKVTAISTNKVYRRTKDIYDMYLLSFLGGAFSTVDIEEVLRSSGLELGDFTDFLYDNKLEKGIKYAYDKLDGIKNKPDYQVVKTRVETFIQPFIHRETSKKGIWQVDPQGLNGRWIFN